MKNIFLSLSLGVIFLFSFLSSLVGVFFMVESVVSNADVFMKGFQLFSLGTILFFILVGVFILTKVLNYAELTSSTLSNLIEYTLNKDANVPPPTTIADLLGGMPNSGIIKMAMFDEDGSITPLGEKEFNSTEDFISKILSKALTPVQKEPKKIEDMSVKELNAEIAKALVSQNYEDAARFRDEIGKKTKKE